MRVLSVLFVLLAITPNLAMAQQKELLKTDGYGSLSGKVTLAGVGPVPALPNVGKPIANNWVIDKDTRAVADVVIWIKPPAKKYLETHPNFKQRAERIVIEAKGKELFLPRATIFNPVYFDGTKMVETGQKLSVNSSSTFAHNVRGTGNPLINPGFNIILPMGTAIDLTAQIRPQTLPMFLQSDIYPSMHAELYIFDHPYYAITKADGTYTIPFVPAGAEVFIMGRHEAVGYVVNTNKGKAITIGKDKKHTFDFEVTK